MEEERESDVTNRKSEKPKNNHNTSNDSTVVYSFRHSRKAIDKFKAKYNKQQRQELGRRWIDESIEGE